MARNIQGGRKNWTKVTDMATRRPRYKINYREGDWFQVPLDPGAKGVAVGVMARMDHGGGGLGYFFLFDKLPSPAELAALRPEQADHITQFGDLGLVRGEWPILGQVPGWDRETWAPPRAYSHQDAISKRWYLRFYEPWNLYDHQVPTTEKEAAQYPQDGLSGGGAVVGYLSRLAEEGRTRTLTKRPLLAAKVSAA
jgi:hypothetical protein